MPSLFSIVRLATAATVLFASGSLASINPTPTRRDTLSINPPSTGLNPLSGLSLVSARGLDTNSKRLAHGLGPLPPRSLAAKKSHLSKARSNGPKRSTPSGTACTPRVGNVQIVDATSGAPMGYMANDVNEFGEYVLATEAATPLEINFKQCQSDPFEIVQMNTCGCMPYKNIGAIQGYSSTSVDLAVGSYNYVVIGGVTATGSASVPSTVANSFTYTTNTQKMAESEVWILDASLNLSLQWVNSDSSVPPTQWALIGGILVGFVDIDVMTKTFGPLTLVKLVFVAGAGASTSII